jgi:murein DD-endopeptidase MepM/ murein hydrolase activator NlpD
MRIVTLLLALSLAFTSHALTDSRVPGGVALIDIPANAQPRFRDQPVLTVLRDNRHLAVVGLPLSLKPGTYHLETAERRIPFEVTGKRYLEQRIYLDNARQVNPNPLDLERIKKEATRQRAVLNAHAGSLDRIDLILPVEGPISSPFGKRRFFNDQPRRPHSGTDIAAPVGTPLKAAAAGQIALVGDFFFNGRLVIIDHGEGLKTMYNHMDQIEVSEGDQVSQGQRIGTVGATGRVTGPHLHFGVIINGASVDPSLFVNAINRLPQ